MPLSVCRCCGGKIPPEQLRLGSNPNICPSCERLLEDESPSLMADIGGLEIRPADGKELLDQPSPPPTPESAPPDKAPHPAKPRKT